MKKIFVAKLDYNTTSEDLEDAFAAYGAVSSAKVIFDRDTGRSRGFGFVEMDDDEAEEFRHTKANCTLIWVISYRFDLERTLSCRLNILG